MKIQRTDQNLKIAHERADEMVNSLLSHYSGQGLPSGEAIVNIHKAIVTYLAEEQKKINTVNEQQ